MYAVFQCLHVRYNNRKYKYAFISTLIMNNYHNVIMNIYNIMVIIK
jgi:hypothetical protein